MTHLESILMYRREGEARSTAEISAQFSSNELSAKSQIDQSDPPSVDLRYFNAHGS